MSLSCFPSLPATIFLLLKDFLRFSRTRRAELPGALQKLGTTQVCSRDQQQQQQKMQTSPRPIKSKSTFQESHLDSQSLTPPLHPSLDLA